MRMHPHEVALELKTAFATSKEGTDKPLPQLSIAIMQSISTSDVANQYSYRFVNRIMIDM